MRSALGSSGKRRTPVTVLSGMALAMAASVGMTGLGPVDEAYDDVRRRLGADALNGEDAGDEGDGGEDGCKGAFGSS